MREQGGDETAPTVGFHAWAYSAMFLWTVSQFTFWLGTLQEPECSTSIVVFMIISSLLLLCLTFSHCLVYASYETGCKAISVKYQREKDRLEANARSVRRTLLKVVFYEALLFLAVSVVAIPFLFINQIPKYLPGDEMLSCRVSWFLLLVDGAGCILMFVLWLLWVQYKPESLEFIFKTKKRASWDQKFYDEDKEERQK